MKILRCAPAAALGVAAVVPLLSTESDAYSLTGTVLGLDQRDFRVFNNFPNPEANDNTTPHPSFPGQTGAVMAIWKASVEWGSELHGDGEGDPHQPGDIGSGGANFDATFQGQADGPGGIGDNIHSSMLCGGGTISFFEESPGGGWRIRYCSEWCWDDGPGTTVPDGCLDLQGVAAHEYGHAIGLGHSSVNGSTMYPSISGSGVSARSIALDDIHGIQAAYGTAAPSKPHIASLSSTGGEVTITGSNFTPTGNEVWFTHAGPGGNGDPVAVTGVSSSAGGTQLTVPIPADAGPGDVLVKANASGGEALSNAFPAATCPDPTAYCSTAPNSVGSGARMAWSGSTNVAADDFVLVCTDAPPGQNGLFYYGPGTAQVPFGDGFRCVAGPFGRLGVVTIDAGGVADDPLDIDNPPSAMLQITAGSTWFFQFWYRDPAFGGSGFNLSDGLRATFCP